MIRLSGYVPYRDIDIVETGLRPGEKLYEELLIASRDIEQTENSQIFIERQPAITPGELREKLEILQEALEKDDSSCIREALHRVVPTFHEPEEVNCGKAPRSAFRNRLLSDKDQNFQKPPCEMSAHGGFFRTDFLHDIRRVL